MRFNQLIDAQFRAVWERFFVDGSRKHDACSLMLNAQREQMFPESGGIAENPFHLRSGEVRSSSTGAPSRNDREHIMNVDCVIAVGIALTLSQATPSLDHGKQVVNIDNVVAAWRRDVGSA